MRRSARLAAMAKILVDRPNRIVSLSEFVDRFGAAKSTVSEDLAIIRDVFAKEGLGRIETITGAAGGVRYVPHPSRETIAAVAEELCRELSSPDRILPGGFLYISDLVSSPSLMSRVGEIFAAQFHGKAPDAVVTLETRGIPVALMTARALDVPLAIVRRTSRATEGTVVTTNYVSGSARRIETMSLSRRALSPGMNVVIVDDFMKAEGPRAAWWTWWPSSGPPWRASACWWRRRNPGKSWCGSIFPSRCSKASTWSGGRCGCARAGG